MMPKKVVSIAPDGTHANPHHRFRWFEYVEEDAEEDDVPYRLRVRTNLTYGERENIRDAVEVKKADREIWPIIAPYVIEWNISGVDGEGNDVVIPPPCDDPEQFAHIPPALFGALYRDLVVRVPLPLARKTLQPSEPTPDSPDSES